MPTRTEGRWYPGQLDNCTCTGTAPGWPQHESWCGVDVDALMEREANREHTDER